MLANVVRASARFTTRPLCRSMSTNIDDIDWGYLRGNLPSEELKRKIDDRRTAMANRLRAAKNVSEPDSIDWEKYANQLPNVDVYRLRDDFNKFLDSIPNIPYDAEAEAAQYTEKEAEVNKIREFAQARVEELRAVKDDMDSHKLTDQTTADEIYLRFPHWYEQEVAQALRMQVYRTEEEPDARETATDEEKVNIIVSMARKSGLPAEDFLFEDEAHLKERVLEAEATARAADATAAHEREEALFDQLYNVPHPTHYTEELGGTSMTRRFESYIERKDQEWKDSFKHQRD